MAACVRVFGFDHESQGLDSVKERRCPLLKLSLLCTQARIECHTFLPLPLPLGMDRPDVFALLSAFYPAWSKNELSPLCPSISTPIFG